MNIRTTATSRVIATTTSTLISITLFSPCHPAVAKPEAVSDASTGPKVTAAAWRAGRAAFGDQVTASQAVKAYWTPQRMRLAIPIEDAPGARSGGRSFAAPPRSTTAQLPRERSVEPYRPSPPPAPRPAATDPELPASHPTARTSGKVFFSGEEGNFVCSGTVVNSEGQDSVWTAGHCVHGGAGGDWYSNWEFVPAYDGALEDPRPYGAWTADQLWAPHGWTDESDHSDDMAVALMTPNDGDHIVALLGGQGFLTHAGYQVAEFAFGYPNSQPFDGSKLYYCEDTSAEGHNGSDTIKISCDMTKGSSGGAWLKGWDGQWGYLNGVVSTGDQAGTLWSPYFDDTAWNLFSDTRYL